VTYHTTVDVEVDRAAARAGSAAAAYAAWSADRRRDLLYACADRLEAAREELAALAVTESGLTPERIGGEITRTTNQMRLYGDHVAAGRHLSSRRSDGVALGGADVRTIDVPLGPVAVFAASNFPFAFGVPGGDTASALAAGCPVVVKGHPAQPELSRRIAELLTEAVDAAGAPSGTFTFIASADNKVAIALVQHPAVKAVGFTGSLGGGRALMDAAASRPDPIPVYAEMSSVNPVFVLPEAAKDEKWADVLSASVLGSAGQLCTKPGLIFVPDNADGRSLAGLIGAKIADSGPIPMLTDGMAAAHAAWRTRLREARESLQADLFASDPADGADAAERSGYPVAIGLDAKALSGDLVVEHFGPAVVLVRADPADYASQMAHLEGQLTATIIAADGDEPAGAKLLPTLAAKAGRVVWNNVPTGVAVCEAMQHGGPWPATSAAWSTSVGTEAIKRFVRPVALQGVPEDLAVWG
jgi:acyl-CoA reductase-like NAD-dependent aldehyde dehydrogenase